MRADSTIRAWERETAGLAPVFIVGAARSGTSILYRSIQSHPSFTPAKGIHLVESHAMRLLPHLRSRRDVVWSPLADFLIGGGALQALAEVARDIEPLALRRKLVRRIAHPLKTHPLIWRAAGEHRIVRRYFLEAHRRRGAIRMVEKTPMHLAWVPHLGIAFPDARFLLMIRHPVDVLSSYWSRYQADPVGSAWMNLTPEAFCSNWETTTRRAAELAEREPRFLLIRYEEFTTRTEPTMRRIFAHLGESFDEACLLRGEESATESGRGVSEEVGEHVRGVLRHTPHLRSVVTQTTKRWEDYVDAATANRVERRLKNAMELVGYVPRSRPAVQVGEQPSG